MPTSPLADEGQTMEPSVSVPRVAQPGWPRMPGRSSSRTDSSGSRTGLTSCPPPHSSRSTRRETAEVGPFC